MFHYDCLMENQVFELKHFYEKHLLFIKKKKKVIFNENKTKQKPKTIVSLCGTSQGTT